MLRKALQAMVPAGNDELLGAGVTLHRLAIVEHLIARLDDQQVALRRDAGQVELFPLAQVRLRELVRLAGVKVGLGAEVGAQADMGIDGRIDQHRFQAVLFREVRGIEAAEGRTDQRGVFSDQWLNGFQRISGKRRQSRTGELGLQTALAHVALHDLRLVRARRGVEPVEVDDQAAAFSRASSLSWMPPKPPFDITSTWSPALASPATAAISGSSASSQRARAPSSAKSERASQPSPAV